MDMSDPKTTVRFVRLSWPRNTPGFPEVVEFAIPGVTLKVIDPAIVAGLASLTGVALLGRRLSPTKSETVLSHPNRDDNPQHRNSVDAILRILLIYIYRFEYEFSKS